MNDQIKTISLALIAVSLLVQTFIQLTSSDGSSTSSIGQSGLPSYDNASTLPDTPPLNNNTNTQPTNAQPVEPDQPLTTMVFSEYDHDFGLLTEGDKVTYVFEFKNTGPNPLIIKNARGSCGCTVPEWPREPIAPGESGNITVNYDSKNRKGIQDKTVSITANTDPQIIQLKIHAKIAQQINLGENVIGGDEAN
ncbi:DUF1573 domain-containing protein [Sphingobacteriaceae bacterium AH-315-L07]|nr:DUF1573 domain-containing protein [Bacteroidia bacterium]MBN4052240.1 DUF1573 domain-containing protein [Sphingobacteriaceae bacterium AH-315-L07]